MLEALDGPKVVATFDDDASEDKWCRTFSSLVESKFCSLVSARKCIWEHIREDAEQAGITLDAQELKQGYCTDLTKAIDALDDEFGRFFSEETQKLGRE